MRNYFYGVIFVLALSTAYAVSQMQSSQPQTNTPPAATTTAPDASQSNPSSTYPSDQSNGVSNQSSAGQASQTSNGSQTATSGTTSNSVNDQDLQARVQQQLATNPALSSVNVTVKGRGVVVLDGSVATKNDKRKAKKLAESISGVRKVKNHLKVEKSAGGATGSGTTASAGAASGVSGQSSIGRPSCALYHVCRLTPSTTSPRSACCL